jgi:hypothetical protein
MISLSNVEALHSLVPTESAPISKDISVSCGESTKYLSIGEAWAALKALVWVKLPEDVCLIAYASKLGVMQKSWSLSCKEDNMNVESLRKIRDQINALIENEEKKDVECAFEEALKERTMTVSEVIEFLGKFPPDAPFFGGGGWVVNLYEDEGFADADRKEMKKGVNIQRLV